MEEYDKKWKDIEERANRAIADAQKSVEDSKKNFLEIIFLSEFKMKLHYLRTIY